ncbi:MAG: MTAP family purine nucleoside phosphorylase [Candidatus Saganbacteria bacterium]|nr:MTAP family purine nucleoside phosphorylase [Candidatus Saganbacteria bacterium]
MKAGIITGSGFYDLEMDSEAKERSVKTKYGQVFLLESSDLVFIARHGRGHKLLPNHINYRANIQAMKELGVDCIIGTTIAGILNPKIQLAHLIIFDDLYFPENRLPSGEICTIYDKIGQKGRGHLIWGKPFSQSLRNYILETAKQNKLDHYDKGIYGYVNGPRFNTAPEVKALQQAKVTAISQTAGPEIVLAAELEIPYQLVGFGVDYANGVKKEPTPIEVLNQNMEKSKTILQKLIIETIKSIKEVKFDQGLVYRIE